jgi:kinesin family member 1
VDLIDDGEDKADRTFTFDHALWSHDGFKVDEKGYNQPVSPQYCDQKKVWELLGV